MSKICTSCHAENVDEAKFCRKCGKDKFVQNSANFNNSENEQRTSEKFSSRGTDDILNAKVKTENISKYIKGMIKEFDKQFQKCLSNKLLPKNFLITSNIVRDMDEKKDYITETNYYQLYLKNNDKFIDAYEVDEKSFAFCYEKAYEMTGNYMAKKNNGWIVFLIVITFFGVKSIFTNNYSLESFLFFGTMLFLTIAIGIIVTKKNTANVKSFDSELKKFMEEKLKQ